MEDTNINIPNEYRPLSAWGYVGYNILFNLPIAGLIFVIVFALDNTYIARRNYARSYLCLMLIGLIIAIIAIILVLVFGISIAGLSSLNY